MSSICKLLCPFVLRCLGSGTATEICAQEVPAVRNGWELRLTDYASRVFTHTTDEFKEEEELAKMDEALEI